MMNGTKMLRVNNKTYVVLGVIIIMVLFLGCGRDAVPVVDTINAMQSPFASFRDVPGVTEEEIAAIEMMQRKYSHFVYGVDHTMEAFPVHMGQENEVGGYAARLCVWLTNLFDIPFVPRLYKDDWDKLLPEFERGDVHFMGDLMPTEERRESHFMTSSIAERSLRAYQINGTRTITEIAGLRPVRLAFPKYFAPYHNVIDTAEYEFESIFIDNFAHAYRLLKNNEVDAFVAMNISMPSMHRYDDIVCETFYPLVFASASLSTRKADLEPIISVVQKALDNGGRLHLAEMHNRGRYDYIRNELFKQLSNEELDYLQRNPVVKVVTETENYPLSFYNNRDNEYQGIFFDVVKEVGLITGLSFEVANAPGASFLELAAMVESNEASIFSTLRKTKEREEHYLFPTTPIIKDHVVLISKSEHPNVQFDEMLDVLTGSVRGTVHAELFKRWFPNNSNYKEYDNLDNLFHALERGEVDMMIAGATHFLSIENYKELPGYKINVEFDYHYDLSSAFCKDEEILCAIMDKTLALIDLEAISSYWANKKFDYRIKIMEARMPWLIGATTMSLVILSLILFLLYRKHNEGKKLAKLVTEVEAANLAKSLFLTTISHEMRTPMNAILGITDIQLHNDLPPETKDALHMIYNSGHSLMAVLNDLLDLSKIEAGKLELINERYETASLINDAINLNVTHMGGKQIEFKLHVDEAMPLELIGDELHIKQILNNLLSNAFRYTESGEVRLSLDTEKSNEVNSNESTQYVTLIITVSDTGQGMTEEQVQRLFDAYSRINLKVNRMVDGTGLGMNIVQQLVKKMNGDIYVDSAVSKGTKITVRLMQGYAGPAKIGKELADDFMNFRLTNILKRKKAQITREHMPYGSILVVDDMETNLYVARGMLLPYGLTIDTALSGAEAIAKIERGNVYDIVFMDHMMPVMDGIETAKVMRDKGYKQPIVALTANAVLGQAEMFMANGFDGFVSKPIDAHELNAILKQFVRDRHPPEEVEAARAAYGSGDAIASEMPQVDPELARIFSKEAEKAIAALESFDGRDDGLPAYIMNVHALKGALANVGEMELSNFARELERAGREGRIAFISGEGPAFLDALRSLVDRLKPEESDAGELTDDDMEYLRQKLIVVKEACALYDKKAAKAALTELKQKLWPGEYGALLDTIGEHLLHSDFDEAEATCAIHLFTNEK